LGREGAAAFLIENESANRAKAVKGTFRPTDPSLGGGSAEAWLGDDWRGCDA